MSDLKIIEKIMAEKGLYVTTLKKSFEMPKNLTIDRCWEIIGPYVAEQIAGPGYTHVPSLINIDAFKIGHVFVPAGFRRTSLVTKTPIFRILGPINKFLKRGENDSKWLASEFPSNQTVGHRVGFRVQLQEESNEIIFTGNKSYYLCKPEDMLTITTTFDRSSHESLADARCIGVITNTMMVEAFQISIMVKDSQRTLLIGDVPHCVAIKYDICVLDENGKVGKSSAEIVKGNWEFLQSGTHDTVPLPQFQ